MVDFTFLYHDFLFITTNTMYVFLQERISTVEETLSVRVRPQNGRKALETSSVARAGSLRRRMCILFLMERRLGAVACPKHPGSTSLLEFSLIWFVCGIYFKCLNLLYHLLVFSGPDHFQMKMMRMMSNSSCSMYWNSYWYTTFMNF